MKSTSDRPLTSKERPFAGHATNRCLESGNYTGAQHRATGANTEMDCFVTGVARSARKKNYGLRQSSMADSNIPSKTMTAEHEQALKWAREQNFSSVSARYAKLCAEAYDIIRSETQEAFNIRVRAALRASDETNERQYDGTAESFYCPNCDCARCGNTRPALNAVTSLSHD